MEVMPSWRVAYAVTIKRADRCEAGSVGPMTRMTTITLAAAAAVTPETMVGANGAMATMGGRIWSYAEAWIRVPAPPLTHYVIPGHPLRRAAVSSSVKWEQSLPPRCCWDENNACHFLGTGPGTRCPVATPKEGDNGTRDEGTVVVEILPRSRRRVGS